MRTLNWLTDFYADAKAIRVINWDVFFFFFFFFRHGSRKL